MDIERIKQTIAMIDDPRLDMQRYPLWHRSMVLNVLAYEHDQGGLLPPLADCAAHLQISVKNLKKTLHRLSKLGWVRETSQGWIMTRLQDNQKTSIRLPRKRHTSAARRNDLRQGSSKQAFPYYD